MQIKGWRVQPFLFVGLCSSCLIFDERQFGMFAGCFVDYNKLTHILPLQLLVSIQKLNPVNGSIRRDIHHEFITYLY